MVDYNCKDCKEYWILLINPYFRDLRMDEDLRVKVFCPACNKNTDSSSQTRSEEQE